MTDLAVQDLYETDYYAWAMQQADAIERLLQEGSNVPLDLFHLADEVRDLGLSERDTVRSQVRRIIEHLLKLEYSPASDPRADWKVSVADARATLSDKLTPTLRRDSEDRVSILFRQAKRIAALGLERFDEGEAARAMPSDCPYSLDQILEDDWYPANRHGLT